MFAPFLALFDILELAAHICCWTDCFISHTFQLQITVGYIKGITITNLFTLLWWLC